MRSTRALTSAVLVGIAAVTLVAGCTPTGVSSTVEVPATQLLPGDDRRPPGQVVQVPPAVPLEPVGPTDELPVRIVIDPNPSASRPNAELSIVAERAAVDGSTVHRQQMAERSVDTRLDVSTADRLDLYVDDLLVFSIPRRFWEERSRGRITIKLQPGGVQLTRAVTGSTVCSVRAGERTCWTGEVRYFPAIVFDGETDTLAVAIKIPTDGSVAPETVIQFVEVAGDTGDERIAVDTKVGDLDNGRLDIETQVLPTSTLQVVVGDRVAVVPPELWQRRWKGIRLHVGDSSVRLESHWPSSPERLDAIRTTVPLVAR